MPRADASLQASRRQAGYDSYAAFYRHAYAPYITNLKPAGSLGAHLFEARQIAGDWSDAPTPDLLLTKLCSPAIACSIDLGLDRLPRTMRTGDVVLTPPGTATRIVIDSTHTIRFLSVPYRSLLALAGERAVLLPPDGDFGPLHATYLRDPALGTLLDGVWAEAGGASPHGALFFEGAVLQTLARLLRLREGRPAAPARGGLAPWQVRRVGEYMAAHLEEDLALAELAALVGLSPAHFCRAFRQTVGVPPHRFLLERRVERTKALMVDPRLGLAEIALSVGYNNQSAFGTAFRKVTGASPGQWRRGL